MPREQTLPLETNFYPNQKNPREYDKPHVWEGGEYVERSAVKTDYPKVKYHADYIHNPPTGKELGFTEMAQLVHSLDEELKLGPEWLDAPKIVTAPNVEQVSEKKRKESSNWRSAASITTEGITEHHVEFAQAQGVPNVSDIPGLYKFLGTLTGAQMNAFMKEAAAWKRGPGRPKAL